jgi:hypothetical protein
MPRMKNLPVLSDVPPREVPVTCTMPEIGRCVRASYILPLSVPLPARSGTVYIIVTMMNERKEDVLRPILPPWL